MPGRAVVIVQHVMRSRSRTWAVDWPTWLEMRSTIGRQSIPLEDARRPFVLLELPRYRRENDDRTLWDMRVLMAP